MRHMEFTKSKEKLKNNIDKRHVTYGEEEKKYVSCLFIILVFFF